MTINDEHNFPNRSEVGEDSVGGRDRKTTRQISQIASWPWHFGHRVEGMAKSPETQIITEPTAVLWTRTPSVPQDAGEHTPHKDNRKLTVTHRTGNQKRIFRVEISDTVRRIYVPLRLMLNENQRETSFFHDSGSDISVITTQALDRLNKQWKRWLTIEKPDIHIQSFSQHEVKIIGKVNLTCQWQHAKTPFTSDFYLMKGTENIIGRDILMRFEASIIYKPSLALEIKAPPEQRGITICTEAGDNERTLTATYKLMLKPKI